MDIPKDHQDLISNDMSSLVRKQLYQTKELNDYFATYITSEKYCRLDILQFITRYSGIVVRTNMIKNEDIKHFGINEVIESNINKTAKIVENIFAAGLLYGAAKSDENFYKQMNTLNDGSIIDELDDQLNNLELGYGIGGEPLGLLEPPNMLEDLEDEEDDEEYEL